MNIENIIGNCTSDDMIELMRGCIDNLTDEDSIQVIREVCLEDEDWCNELIADIEGLAT